MIRKDEQHMQSGLPLVSIIVPVYNVKLFVKRCIDSLISQTYKNLEIILIDDGSTDGSGDICDVYSEKYENIRVFHQENSGVSEARNKGILLSRGEFISFVDSDDWIEYNMLDNLIRYSIECGADAVFCGYFRNTDQDEVSISPVDNGIIAYPIIRGHCLNYAEKGESYGSGACNKIFRTKIIKGIKFNNNFSVGEDELFLLEVFRNNYKVYACPKCYYHYYLRKGSATQTKGLTRQKIDQVMAGYYILQKYEWEKVHRNFIMYLNYLNELNCAVGSYADKDVSNYIKFVKQMGKFKKEWKQYSTKLGDTKRWLVLIMMKLHFNSVLIEALYGLNIRDIKNKLRDCKNN